jgi:predicted nucleic acid-binding protein
LVLRLGAPAVGEETKHQVARCLIGKLDRPLVTPQILNELAFNLLRKRAWSEPELRELMADLHRRCRFFVPGADWHEHASVLREKYNVVLGQSGGGFCMYWGLRRFIQ